MHSPHLGNSSPLPSFHTIGFLEHGTISKEVRTTIDGNKIYVISEILASGSETKKEIAGRDILKNCSTIFGNWLHGFIVMEKGGVLPVFVYRGPISARVFDIISPNLIH